MIGGLGGRDITENTLKEALDKSRGGAGEAQFLDLNPNIEMEGITQ